MGGGAADLEHRFQWTFPIVISPHDHDVVYVGAEVLFKTADGGQTWDVISPDLTTNDRTKQASSGGPITQDNTSVEYYCTIFTVAESPLRAGMIWVGTDDGLVHLTMDGGTTWENVTPPDMGDWPLVSMVEASPHDADTAYLAVNRYKMDDFRPTVYRTTDRGRSWRLVADGIDDGAFVRVVREDPERAGLLFAGTETGVWVSFDHGDAWQSIQLELPAVPVTDLVLHGDDVVISTQGRSFWILDGLARVRTLSSDLAASEPHLFAPAPAYRQRWDEVDVHFNLPEELEEPASLEFVGTDGEVIRSFSISLEDGDDGNGDEDGDDEDDDEEDEDDDDDDDDETISGQAGLNRYRWNMRRENPVRVPGAVGWPPAPPGSRVIPGSYSVRLQVGGETLEESFEIRPDPRVETTTAEYQAQGELLAGITDALSAAHRAVNTIRSIRRQIDTTVRRAKKAGLDDGIRETAETLKDDLTSIEDAIIQSKSKSSQDPLNYPVRLNDKIGALLYTVEGDYGPTDQARAVFDRLKFLLDEELERLAAIVDTRVGAFNDLVREQRVPAVVVEDDDDDEED